MIRFRVIGISKDRRSPELKARGEELDRAFEALRQRERKQEVKSLVSNVCALIKRQA